MSNSRIDLTV